MEVGDNNVDGHQNKYITVRIEIPIEIFMDGNYILLDEYLNMEFVECPSKPEKITSDKKMFLEKYQKMLVDIIASSALSDPVEYLDEESNRDNETEVNPTKMTEIETIISSNPEDVESKSTLESKSLIASNNVIIINPKNVGKSRKRSSNISFKRKPRVNDSMNNNSGILRRFTIKNWGV